MAVINSIAGDAGLMREWRHWLHRNPELGFDLPKTTAFVAERLREIGVDEIHEGIGRSGIVAVINGQGPGPTIGLRADMDALPIHETTGADHASETPGKMHACGHDGHTTMLLGAARYLAQTRNFAGRAVLVFQPAEEIGGGARAMVEDGLMERFGIERIFGIHNGAKRPVGTFVTRPGPYMSSADRFRITVTGRGGHGAYPHETVDPIPVLVSLAQALDTIVSRNRRPDAMLVVSVTQIHAGSAFNIVPGSGWLEGTIRTLDEGVRNMVERRVGEIARGHAESYGVTVDVDYTREMDVTVNHAAEAALAAAVAAEIVGEDAVDADCPPIYASEDFGVMLQARPGAYLHLGQGGDFGVHEAGYDFNDDIAPIGASFFARLVETALPLGQGGRT